MKDIYKDKIARMHKGSRSRHLAEYIAIMPGVPFTIDEIIENTRIKTRQDVTVAVRNLRVAGWQINNLNKNGDAAVWVLRGVGNSGHTCAASFARPELHPLIEKVFR